MLQTKIKKVLIYANRSDIKGSENIFALSKEVQVVITDSLSEIRAQLKEPYVSPLALVVNPYLLKSKALPELVEVIRQAAAKHSDCRLVVLNTNSKQNNSSLLHINIISHLPITHLMAPVALEEVFKLLDIKLNYLEAIKLDRNLSKNY